MLPSAQSIWDPIWWSLLTITKMLPSAQLTWNLHLTPFNQNLDFCLHSVNLRSHLAISFNQNQNVFYFSIVGVLKTWSFLKILPDDRVDLLLFSRIFKKNGSSHFFYCKVEFLGVFWLQVDLIFPDHEI